MTTLNPKSAVVLAGLALTGCATRIDQLAGPNGEDFSVRMAAGTTNTAGGTQIATKNGQAVMEEFKVGVGYTRHPGVLTNGYSAVANNPFPFGNASGTNTACGEHVAYGNQLHDQSVTVIPAPDPRTITVTNTSDKSFDSSDCRSVMTTQFAPATSTPSVTQQVLPAVGDAFFGVFGSLWRKPDTTNNTLQGGNNAATATGGTGNGGTGIGNGGAGGQGGKGGAGGEGGEAYSRSTSDVQVTQKYQKASYRPKQQYRKPEPMKKGW